ncbi:hypothetical protein [Cohnella sp. GbtcB17]|uniref:hypothetical protein n=1 Tax=Cohnella sp. GbtcB17 TaxID=2824762 RepID=UPI001C2FD9A2|nr:hypothetical protein [Cohnella sp. GbtcB17]
MRNTVAVVTSQGILYQNHYYTCWRAISEQWFDQASAYLMLELDVQVKDDLLYIVLESGESITLSIISSTKKYTTNEREEYFVKLNQLKLEKGSIKNDRS